ncbi:unnamed protein product [Caenorhabditis bovis]|uniref:Uncharacterized protein n=1 Tax=Caenorhabditis bovis TaxID=2654633 RepID=A0A8S1ENW2_9PELO|nr:unnamed protein product [Caenorhabditis bovis]
MLHMKSLKRSAVLPPLSIATHILNCNTICTLLEEIGNPYTNEDGDIFPLPFPSLALLSHQMPDLDQNSTYSTVGFALSQEGLVTENNGNVENNLTAEPDYGEDEDVFDEEEEEDAFDYGIDTEIDNEVAVGNEITEDSQEERDFQLAIRLSLMEMKKNTNSADLNSTMINEENRNINRNNLTESLDSSFNNNTEYNTENISPLHIITDDQSESDIEKSTNGAKKRQIGTNKAEEKRRRMS